MVVVSKLDNNFIFEVKGLHKVWSFKSELIIPVEHVVSATQKLVNWTSWEGWRMPGTAIPFLIVAGTYYKDGEKNFWDVVDKNKAIIIELKDETYNNLVIEVENVEETLNLLNSK